MYADCMTTYYYFNLAQKRRKIYNPHALIKEKIKFSSYMRKFRVEHAVAKSYMRRPLLIYDFATGSF
jgi:hypothetical protein